MTDRIDADGLHVAKSLYDFVNQRAVPGTGLNAEAVWRGFAAIIRDLAPRNRDLLAKREALQARIDGWYRENQDKASDPVALREFLTEIGYLVPGGRTLRSRPTMSTPRLPISPARSWWCR